MKLEKEICRAGTARRGQARPFSPLPRLWVVRRNENEKEKEEGKDRERERKKEKKKKKKRSKYIFFPNPRSTAPAAANWYIMYTPTHARGKRACGVSATNLYL